MFSIMLCTIILNLFLQFECFIVDLCRGNVTNDMMMHVYLFKWLLQRQMIDILLNVCCVF
jgi:hypothetical protein